MPLSGNLVAGGKELLRTLISATAGLGLLDDAFQHGNRTSSTPRLWQQSSQPARVCRQRTAACPPLVQMLMRAIDRPTRVLHVRACVRVCVRAFAVLFARAWIGYTWAAFQWSAQPCYLHCAVQAAASETHCMPHDARSKYVGKLGCVALSTYGNGVLHAATSAQR